MQPNQSLRFAPAFVLLLMLSFPFLSGYSQNYFKSLGTSNNDESAPYLAYTDDGNLIMAGTTTLNDDLVVTKTDLNGNVIWSRNIGTLGAEQAAGIANDGAGGYIIAGLTDDFGPALLNGFFMRLDATGNVSWVKNCGITQLEQYGNMHPVPGGGAVLAGGFSFNGGIDFFVTKLDTAGNLIWSRTVGSPSTAELTFNAIPTSDGGALIAGVTSQGFGSDDILICKLSSTGALSWSKLYGSTVQDFAADAVEVSDGYVVVGRTAWLGGSNGDAMLMKLDTAGNEVWTKILQTSGNDQFSDIEVRPGGTLEVFGRTNGAGAGFNDFVRIQLSGTGTILNTWAYGTTSTDNLDDATILPDGSLVMVGTRDNNSRDEWAIARVDSAGMFGCLDTTFAFTVIDTAFLTTTPVGIVSTAGGSLQNKTHVAATYPMTTTTLCSACNLTASFQASDTVVCEGDTVQLQDLSGGSATEWKLNGATFDTNISTSLVLSTPGVQTLTLVTSSGASCADSTTFSIRVEPVPTWQFEWIDSCAPADVLIYNTTSGSGIANWVLGGTTVANQDTLQPSGINGPLSVTMTVGNACPTLDSVLNPYPAPSVAWNFSPNGLTVDFTDQTIGNIASWFWEFGDGSTSTDQNPTHTYQGSGGYNVCLSVVTVEGCSDTACDPLSVMTGLDPEEIPGGVMVYPNPSSGQVTVEVDPEIVATLQSFRLLDLYGREVRNFEDAVWKDGAVKISFGNALSGMYVLELRNDSGFFRTKLRLDLRLGN